MLTFLWFDVCMVLSFIVCQWNLTREGHHEAGGGLHGQERVIPEDGFVTRKD